MAGMQRECFEFTTGGVMVAQIFKFVRILAKSNVINHHVIG